MALIYPQNGDLKKLLKSSRKKVPQSARLSAGGGGQKLKGQCPNAPSMNLRKASLTYPVCVTAAVKPAVLLPLPLVITDKGASWASYLEHWKIRTINNMFDQNLSADQLNYSHL